MTKTVTIDNLSFSYTSEPVLDGVNVCFKKNKFTGIIGPNGSGKTTLIKNILKTVPVENNVVYISGQDINTYSRKNLAKQMASVPQMTSLDYSFSVMDIVLMGRNPHIKRFQSESKRDLEIVHEVMKQTKIYEFRDRDINHLSGGERQRVIIARALAQEPKILVLDEPINHLDIQHQIDLLKLIRKLCHEKNITIISILHDLNFAMEFCEDVLLINKGKVVKYGHPHEVITKDNIKSVYNIDINVIKMDGEKLYIMPKL